MSCAGGSAITYAWPAHFRGPGLLPEPALPGHAVDDVEFLVAGLTLRRSRHRPRRRSPSSRRRSRSSTGSCRSRGRARSSSRRPARTRGGARRDLEPADRHVHRPPASPVAGSTLSTFFAVAPNQRNTSVHRAACVRPGDRTLPALLAARHVDRRDQPFVGARSASRRHRRDVRRLQLRRDRRQHLAGRALDPPQLAAVDRDEQGRRAAIPVPDRSSERATAATAGELAKPAAESPTIVEDGRRGNAARGN